MALQREEKKFKLGFWSGFIGGTMLALTGTIGIIDFRAFWGFNEAFLLPYFLTFYWGVIALIGATLLFYNHGIGDYFLIESGALAIFCMFFPLPIYEFGRIFTVYLSYTFAFIDPFLVLLGGIIDLLVRKGIIWS